ncbi:hypothetical protein QQG55_47870 [Brugia pahangi]
MIEYLSMANEDKRLPKKSDEVQFRILDFVTLQFLERIDDIVGKTHLRKALHRWFRLADHIFCFNCGL